MNARERIQAYLDARAEDYMLPDTGGVIAYVPPSITGTAQQLTVADLEEMLQESTALHMAEVALVKDNDRLLAWLEGLST